MFVFWTHNNDVKRKLLGQRVKRHCSKCNQDATFYECEANNNVKVFGMFDLYEKKEVVLQCGECLALFKADQGTLGPGDKSPADDHRSAAEEAKRQAEEAKRRAEEEKRLQEEKARAEAAENARLSAARKEREAAIDAELAELKKNLGK